MTDWEQGLGWPLPAAVRQVLERPGPGLFDLDRGFALLARPEDAGLPLPFPEERLRDLVDAAQTDPSAVLYDPDADPPPLHGVLPVADAGDGLLHVVICRGPRAGQVWLAGEAWAPVLDAGGQELDLVTWARQRAAPDPPAPPLPTALQRALRKPEKALKLTLSDWYADTIPDVFAPLVALKSLDISGNGARTLPPSLGGARLEKVWLTSMPQLEDLRPVCGPTLELLNVSRSPRVDLGPVVGCANLVDLYAMFTELRHLPEGLAALPKLRRVSLRESFHLDLRQAWPVLARCPALEILDLGESRLLDWPEVLERPPRLKTLDLTRTELPDGVLDRLREALPGVTLRVEEG